MEEAMLLTLVLSGERGMPGRNVSNKNSTGTSFLTLPGAQKIFVICQ